MLRAPGLDVEQLILIEPFKGHHIDFDAQTRGARGLDPREDLGQAAPSGDGGEFIILERIKRDIDPPHPQIIERLRKAAELAAIGGEGQFLERACFQMPSHRLEKGHDATAHQGFPACDPQFLDPKIDETGTKPIQLFQAQQFGLGQECHILRHTVDAAKIAAIRDGDAQIGNRAGKWVD